MILLRRRLQGIEGARVFGSFAKIATASAVMGAATVALDRLLAVWLPGDPLLLQLLRVTLTIGGALAVLAGAAHVLHIREFREGMALVTRRLRRRS
jgi:hypothetical protein